MRLKQGGNEPGPLGCGISKREVDALKRGTTIGHNHSFVEDRELVGITPRLTVLLLSAKDFVMHPLARLCVGLRWGSRERVPG
jgi:hypothetical protein